MTSKRSALISSITYLIEDIISSDIFFDKSLLKDNKNGVVLEFFGISDTELVEIISFVVDILPETIYLEKYKEVSDYTAGYIAKELLLFLAREELHSGYLKNNLENLRDEILHHILTDIYLDDNDKLIKVTESHV